MQYRIITLCLAASLLLSASSSAQNPNDTQFINLLSLLHRQGTLGEAELRNLAEQAQNNLYANAVANPFAAQQRAHDRRIEAAANLIDGTIVALQPNPAVVAAWARRMLQQRDPPQVEIDFADDEPPARGRYRIWLQGPPRHIYFPVIFVIGYLAQGVGQDFSRFRSG